MINVMNPTEPRAGNIFNSLDTNIQIFLVTVPPPIMFVFERLTERPHFLPPRQTLQEEPCWSLKNNISLESGHSLKLKGEERVIISGIEWRAFRWSGREKRPKFFELSDRSFRGEDLVDVTSELVFSPIVGWVTGTKLFVE